MGTQETLTEQILMKKATLIALGMAALLPQADAACTPTIGSDNPAVTTQTMTQRILRPQFGAYDACAQDCSRDITFPEAMVTPESVGQPPAPGVLSMENAGDAKAFWLSTDTLRIAFDPYTIPPLTATTFRIGENLHTLGGNQVAPLSVQFCARQVRVESGCCGKAEEAPTFFTIYDENDRMALPKLRESISRAEIVIINEETEEVISRRPIDIRPATAGEALENIDRLLWWGFNRDEVRKELEQMAPATEMSDMWMAPAVGYPSEHTRIELQLPGIRAKCVPAPNTDCVETISHEPLVLFRVKCSKRDNNRAE